MKLNVATLRTAATAVCARDGADLASLPRGELLALAADVAALRREVDLLAAAAAAEIDRRSTPDDGASGLAASSGFRSAADLIARTSGGSVAEARRLVAAGGLLADADAGVRETPADTGHVPPSPAATVRAALGEALREGRLSVEAASVLASALAASPDDERTADLFRRALGRAPALALHDVRALAWRAQAMADPAAWAERESRQHDERSVTLRDDVDGMVTLTARLTPLAGAKARAVLDAGVRRALQERRDALAAREPGADERTPAQTRADLLEAVFSHALDCDLTPSGVKTTVVVRMMRAELESGLGLGEVEGVRAPVSAGALRRAAADAEIIPAVLGGESEVLDLGRARRLFTKAQRLALAERDGGCAWCNAPPSWCEAHHLRWWDLHGGGTDLANGILLCTRCHHRVHRDGWAIEIRDGAPWFTLPRTVDPSLTPVMGGRRRFAIAA